MSGENVERLRAVYREWEQGNFRAGGDLLADDIVFQPFSDAGKPATGRAALDTYMREFLAQWSDFRVTAEELFDAGEKVLVVECQRGTGKASGLEMESTFYAVWEFRDGKVVWLSWTTDRAQAFAEAGLADQGA